MSKGFFKWYLSSVLFLIVVIIWALTYYYNSFYFLYGIGIYILFEAIIYARKLLSSNKRAMIFKKYSANLMAKYIKKKNLLRFVVLIFPLFFSYMVMVIYTQG